MPVAVGSTTSTSRFSSFSAFAHGSSSSESSSCGSSSCESTVTGSSGVGYGDSVGGKGAGGDGSNCPGPRKRWGHRGSFLAHFTTAAGGVGEPSVLMKLRKQFVSDASQESYSSRYSIRQFSSPGWQGPGKVVGVGECVVVEV